MINKQILKFENRLEKNGDVFESTCQVWLAEFTYEILPQK